MTGCVVDPRLTDLNNYYIVRYKNWHLGSYGQRVGVHFGGIDDYDLIYPKFNTCLYNTTTETEGSFNKVIIDWGVFQTFDPQNQYTYDRATNKTDYNILKNVECKNGLSVMVIGDSYSSGINPFMILSYSNYKFYRFDKLSVDLLNENQPDVLMFMIYPGNLNRRDLFLLH